MSAAPARQALAPLRLEDRLWIEPLLAATPCELGARTFPGLYLWRDCFEYGWRWLEGYFCLFARYGPHTYMPWPPLPGPAARLDRWAAAVAAAFSLMDASEDRGVAARIEGVDEREHVMFQAAGYDTVPHATEYLYRRDDLVSLRGNRYKSKRWAWNDFTRRHVSLLEPMQPRHAAECLALYRTWAETKRRHRDPFIAALAEDAEHAHRRAFTDLEPLGLSGLVVRIGGTIEGYTVGGPVMPHLFGVYLEIANPSITGLSVYLFRELCRAQEAFEWITAMDDSGLPALARAKQSYRPARLIRSWIIRRPADSLR